MTRLGLENGHWRSDKNWPVNKLHYTGLWGLTTAGCRLQLQHCDVVWGFGGQNVPRHKQGQLWALYGPVSAKVKAVDPHLALEREREKTE